MGEGMDLSWIEKPHEYEPRRVYSNTGADWQMRIDFDRMRRERLQKAGFRHTGVWLRYFNFVSIIAIR